MLASLKEAVLRVVLARFAPVLVFLSLSVVAEEKKSDPGPEGAKQTPDLTRREKPMRWRFGSETDKEYAEHRSGASPGRPGEGHPAGGRGPAEGEHREEDLDPLSRRHLRGRVDRDLGGHATPARLLKGRFVRFSPLPLALPLPLGSGRAP